MTLLLSSDNQLSNRLITDIRYCILHVSRSTRSNAGVYGLYLGHDIWRDSARLELIGD